MVKYWESQVIHRFLTSNSHIIRGSESYYNMALIAFSVLKPQFPQKGSVASLYILLHATLRKQDWSLFSSSILSIIFVFMTYVDKYCNFWMT